MPDPGDKRPGATGPSSALNIEVIAPAAGEASVVEEAAILYANGQAAEAKARLLRAVAGEPLGDAAERVWLMLLDLHQELREQKEFDARALEFAVKFGRSAPSWRGAAPAADAMLRTGGGAYLGLGARLSAESAAQIERIRGAAQKSRMLRIDFSRLQEADAAGCAQLLELLQSVRRRGGDAMFTGENVLLGILAKAAKALGRGTDPALWLLRLEILQWQGRQAAFDEAALEYATTYERSPPSFETRTAQPAAAGPTTAGGAGEESALRAPREIVGNAEPFFQSIAAAAARGSVRVDCSELRRMDFVSAGSLLNLASRLKEQGKPLELVQANALVAALLDVMGVSAVASVATRR